MKKNRLDEFRMDLILNIKLLKMIMQRKGIFLINCCFFKVILVIKINIH